MAKLARSIAMVAIVFGMPTAAYAQAATAPHPHAPPPATAVQPAPAQPQQKADPQDACQCPCCQMMMKDHGAKEMPAPPQEQKKQ